MNPELFTLNRIEWSLFCTFTFKRDKMRQRDRSTMFFSLLRETARAARIHFDRLWWALRLEAGERNGRTHYHALIGALPRYALTQRFCLSTMSRWERLGGGIARVRLYDDGLDGVSYILDGLEQAHVQWTQGANLYEMQKFGGHAELTISKSILRHMGSRRYLANTVPSDTTQREVRPSGEFGSQVDTRFPKFRLPVMGVPDSQSSVAVEVEQGAINPQTGAKYVRSAYGLFSRLS